ncbi:MAG: hypothetical protein AB7L90_25145, partial [Hyphomicrobiaceae bacterium]
FAHEGSNLVAKLCQGLLDLEVHKVLVSSFGRSVVAPRLAAVTMGASGTIAAVELRQLYGKTAHDPLPRRWLASLAVSGRTFPASDRDVLCPRSDGSGTRPTHPSFRNFRSDPQLVVWSLLATPVDFSTASP